MPALDIKLAFPETLDNTILSTVAECPRKAFWAHMVHLQPKKRSIHLTAGGAYAEALDVFRANFYDKDNPLYHNELECLVKATRALLKHYGYDEELEASEAWAKEAKTPLNLLEMLLAMLEEYPPITDPVQPAIIDGKPAVERSFTLEMSFLHPENETPLLLHGRYDMLADYNGMLYVFDDKTTKQLGYKWADQWDFRSQFTGYVAGAKQFGFPVVGAIVRGHSPQKTAIKFAQAVSARTDDACQEWWDDAHSLTYQAIVFFKKAKTDESEIGTLQTRKHFPTLGKFNGTCDKYGGCPFRSLCATKHPQRWLSDFRIRVWDPTNPNDD